MLLKDTGRKYEIIDVLVKCLELGPGWFLREPEQKNLMVKSI